jgi:hypothetical protein
MVLRIGKSSKSMERRGVWQKVTASNGSVRSQEQTGRSRSLSDSPQPDQRVIQPNITFLDEVVREPYGSSSGYTRPDFSHNFSCTYSSIHSRLVDRNNIQDEVNSCYFCSGVPSLGHDMLTSSNRISHYLVDTESLLRPKPLRISKPPNVNRIPNPPLRRKNSLRSSRRHSKLPQVPPLLYLLKRHQAILSRCRWQDMARRSRIGRWVQGCDA